MIFRTLIPVFVLATLAVAEPLTPEAVTRLALDNNPRLLAARAVVAEAEARASGLGRLPDPELETEFAAGSRERGRFEVGLTQAFPRTSRLRLERRVAAEAIALARLEISAAEADTVARARSALVELAAADAGLVLAERQAALAREFAEAQVRHVKAGQLSALDSAQAVLVAREAELALAEPRAERLAAAFALATELGREADPALAASFDLSLPAETPTSVAVSLASRPDLALAEGALAAGDAEIALARSHGREDYRVGVFAEGEQDRDDLGSREQELKIGLRFSMPLPVRKVAVPAVAEKQAARRRLVLERDTLALAARNEVAASSAALAARHAAARAVADELLPAARAHLAATEAAFGRGEAEVAQVFRARERLAELERSDLAARRAYHLAAVQNLAAAGRLLP